MVIDRSVSGYENVCEFAVRLNRLQSRQATRARLRSAAGHAFAERGVAAASVDSIAEAAGFSRGAFYANYRTKQDLLLEILDETQRHEIQMWQDLLAAAEDLESVLPALTVRFDKYLAQNRGPLLAAELQLEAVRNAAFGAAYEIKRQEILVLVESLVRTLAAKAGTVKAGSPDIDVRMAALMLRALTSGLLLHAGTPVAGEAGIVLGEYLRAMFVKKIGE
jgi:AcrR family transcriptional regulator